MASDVLESLVAVSARVGSDLDLVQAGGGNTSLKDGATLWVKASGKWLAHAAHDDMFLPVPMADIARQLAAEDEAFPQYRTRRGVALRPSVETAVHAVLPQRAVIHVHSVRTIAWAARRDGRTGVAPRLEGLNWSWIPYTHPGIPLAARIQEETHRPDVLILENHGLVVAGEDCESAERLLHEVETRLDGEKRPAAAADIERLEALTAGSDWEPAEDSEVHALASGDGWSSIAAGGTLFPDQCVYLGPGAAVAEKNETLDAAAERYRKLHDFEPVFAIAPGAGVATHRGIKRAARELLLCLKRVVERIPDSAQATYLPPSQVARLLNWDAEKYRIAMARLAN